MAVLFPEPQPPLRLLSERLPLPDRHLLSNARLSTGFSQINSGHVQSVHFVVITLTLCRSELFFCKPQFKPWPPS